jgi:hypothetical protein
MAQKFLSEPFILKKLVRLAGIEPTTPWFVAKYSIQLSYSRPRPALYADFAIWQIHIAGTSMRRATKKNGPEISF